MKQNLSARILLLAASVLLSGSCSNKHNPSESIRTRWARDPETLDPLLLTNQSAIDADYLLHASLLQADFTTHSVTPALAEALPSIQLVGDSLMNLDYSLRPAATWDDGKPVLASDVEFTLKLMFCPGLPNEAARNQYRFVRAVGTAPGTPRRFTVVCRGQSIEFAQASGDFFILSEATLDPGRQLRRYTLTELQHWPATAPPDSALLAVARRYRAAVAPGAASALPGCGPYQLVKWETDRYLRFRRKPHWWGDRVQPAPFVLLARPRQLDYLIIPDAATATLALRRGDLDLYPQMPGREFARLRASPTARAALHFYSTPSHDVVTAGFNTRRPALADALTRRALSRCFDAAGLLQATQQGAGQRTVGIISPSDRANYNDSLALLPFAPNEAAALLRRAGWQRVAGTGWFRNVGQGPRQQLRLLVRYRSDEALFGTVALQFQAATAELDIPVTLRPTEAGAFPAALRAGDFDVYVRVLKGNPFMFNFTPILHTLGVGTGNLTGFSTNASDQLIEAIAAAHSKTQRARLLRRFQALLQREAPLVPLFFLPNRIAASKQLRGLHVSSLKPGYSLMDVDRQAFPSPAP